MSEKLSCAKQEEMRIQDEIEKALEIEFKKATVIASDQAARDAKKKHVRYIFCNSAWYFCMLVCKISIPMLREQ